MKRPYRLQNKQFRCAMNTLMEMDQEHCLLHTLHVPLHAFTSNIMPNDSGAKGPPGVRGPPHDRKEPEEAPAAKVT